MKHWLMGLFLMTSLVMGQSLNVVENEFVKIITGTEGFDYPRFSIETTGGNPSHAMDDQRPLIYGRPKPWTSYTSIAIDGEVYGFGTQTLKRAGKKAKYGQVIDSVVTHNAIVVRSRAGDVLATQTLSLFRNPLTNVNDAVLIEYQLKNEAKVTRNIGLRIMMDTLLGTNDAAPFRIGEEAVVSEKKYEGRDIMDFWQSFDSLANPTVIAQGILRYPPAGLTPPDQLILMNWGALADQPYRVAVNEGASFIRDGEDEPDTALALFYEKKPLGPSQVRTYRTVMGLGGVTLAPGDLALGLTAPTTLAITDPHHYTIIAYVSNTGGFEATNAIARLTLPPGLILVKGRLQVDVGNIQPGGARQLMYVVRVDSKKGNEGLHDVSLVVSSDTLADQVLSRSVTLTGQPRLTLTPVGTPRIERGTDSFLTLPVRISNDSDVAISNTVLSLHADTPFDLPSFESSKKHLPLLPAGDQRIVSWLVHVNQWWQGMHPLPIQMSSDYTRSVTTNAMAQIVLGEQRVQLYYSEPSFFVGDYGYLWLTMIDMPAFRGLNLTLHWDPNQLAPIRISPEPWLIESNPDILSSWEVTGNQMTLHQLRADTPAWRRIIAKWHFKVLKAGDATVQIKQNGKVLNDITLELRSREYNKNNMEVTNVEL
jgi:hypothetical protein